MGSSTNAREFRKAIFNRCELLYAADTNPYTLVVRGLPAFANAQDVVAVGAVTSSQEIATLSRTQRSREETLSCEVIFYSFRAGDEAMEEVVEARAYEMLDELAQYVRVTDTTLGGVVRECFLTDMAADAATDPQVLAKGRMHVLTATFTAQYRVQGA
jgi:hypothetical protein